MNKIVFNVIVALSIFSSALTRAEMMATSNIPIADYLNHMETEAKKKKLTEAERNLVDLARIAQSAIDVKFVSVYATGEKAFARFNQGVLLEAILAKIRTQPEWKQALSPTAKSTLKKNRDKLERFMGANTYAWAWALLQMDEKEASKKLLAELYEMEFLKVMQLKEAVFGLGSTPMGEVEFAFQALMPLATSQDQSLLKEKMAKMKRHVSKLPQSHVVT